MPTESSLPTYHFALIGEEMDHDYWRLVGEGAKDTEAQYDVLVEYGGPRRSNPEEQLKLLDIAIKSKVDGIMVQALNDDFLPMIEKAVNQGIPVITIDTDAPESPRSAYIGTDNYAAGQLAGRTLVEDTEGEATVGIITGSFDNAHHRLRVEGFQDVVEGEEGIEIVAIEESNITRVVAEEKAYTMLNEKPDITALYGTSALDGIGMAAAAESLEMVEDLYMINFDTLEENLQLVEQEKIDALIDQKPYEMGYRSVELMLDILKGQPVQDVYHTEASIVHKENIDQYKAQASEVP
ncbi:sugar-binding protein [Gracilibacillus sp. YIM 98692]|uniref:sugar-binding protein n=1 Tax=Gracilibacillus sp. YIM 98692 TaxID=2663532 RepID=UPI001F09679E|nr:sugar-binding protein [Gracilibacillus sp. YIM 98692]